MRTSLFSSAGVALAVFLLIPINPLAAQDTVKVSFDEFVERATAYSATIEARHKKVALAENRIDQVQNNRFFPDLNLTTAHGFVPGVKTRDPDQYSPGRYYLDPHLENDWENWGFFTQAEISGLQPIFTWGAISNAVKAAQKGADAAQHEFESEKESFKLRLFELYQSALLVSDLQRLVNEAQSQLNEAEKELERLREEGDESIEEKDVFEFRIFKEEFQSMRAEVEQTRNFVNRAWNLVLAADEGTVYRPAERFFDPVPVAIREMAFYKNNALHNRAELRGMAAAEEAARYGADAARSQYYPNLVMGVSAGLGYTPNRPRQNNPFIRNTTNFMSLRAGLGFRQNLNFRQVRTQVQRSEIRQRQTGDFHDAAREGILLELSDRHHEAEIAASRLESKENALRISNEWLRTEQIDFDLGFGNIKNLVDAVKKKMELEADVTELTFEMNMKLARLHRAAGLPLHELMPDASAE